MTDEDPQCQGPTVGDTTVRSWAGTPRADDHDAIARLLRKTPEGAPIIWIARTLFGDHVVSGDKDWQFVKRHGTRYHRVFHPTATIAMEIRPDEYENRETESELLWLKPTATPGDGVLEQQVAERPVADASQSEADDRSRAQVNAEVCLSARRTIETAETWGDLVGTLAGKRLGEEKGTGQRTRLNDVERALRGRDRIRMALAGALTAGYTRAVMVTAPTAPWRFDSILDASMGVVHDAGLLRRWVGRPPGVTVIEPTERGVPHPHIVLFCDPNALPSEHDLHNYWWENRERGQQVDAKPLVTDGGTDVGAGAGAWTWDGDAPDDAEGRPPATYLCQGADALATVARLDAESVLAVATAYREHGDAPLTVDTAPQIDGAVRAETGVDAAAVRRAAWYFGTGCKTATRPSKSLCANVDADDEKY